MAFEFDEIGHWSEIKHDIIKQYAAAYSKIISGWKYTEFHHVYIDAFAGPGKHLSKKTHLQVDGSPSIALNIDPPFKQYYFIEKDPEKAQELECLVKNRPNVKVFCGDCNDVLLKDVFPYVQYKDHCRGLCLLDPYGLHLNWNIMIEAGKMESIEIFLNFPISDMNRNVLWHEKEKVDKQDIKRMNDFWGDESWARVAYSPQPNLFGEIIELKSGNNTMAQAFRERLKSKAGFKNVPKPIPMRNSNNATIYYLFFASHNDTGSKIATDIFNKYRNRGMV